MMHAARGMSEGEDGGRQGVSSREGTMVPFGGHTPVSSSPSSSSSRFSSTSSSLPSLSSLPSSTSSAASSASLESSCTGTLPPADAVPTFLSQQLPYAHLLDTLPYVDALSPEQHEAAKLLVQQEMAAIRRESRRSGSRSQLQQQQVTGSESQKQQQQYGESVMGENASATTTSLDTRGSGSTAAAAPPPAVAGGVKSSPDSDKQQAAGTDSDADADEELLLKSYLRTFPLPSTPHLDDPNTLAGRELVRLARGETLQKLDFSRYEALPSPPAAGNKAQESEWRKSVDNCEGLLEHLGVGQTNLELMNLHAVSLWIRHLHGLSLTEQHWSGAVKRLRDDVGRVSKQRKIDQVECSTSLRDTARMREDYERRNEEILAALGKLQEEVVELKLRCQDRGVLPDDYDSDFDESLDDWETLASSPPPPAPALLNATQSSSSTSSSSSGSSSSSNRTNSSAGDSSRASSDGCTLMLTSSNSSSSGGSSSRSDEAMATQIKRSIDR